MRTKLKTLGLAAAVSVFALPAFAAEEVKIGVPSWTGAQAIAHLLGAVVEMRIGGKVEYVPGNNATIFQAMDQGKGDIDVHPRCLAAEPGELYQEVRRWRGNRHAVVEPL